MKNKSRKDKIKGWEDILKLSTVTTSKMDMSEPMEVFKIGFVKNFIKSLLKDRLNQL